MEIHTYKAQVLAIEKEDGKVVLDVILETHSDGKSITQPRRFKDSYFTHLPSLKQGDSLTLVYKGIKPDYKLTITLVDEDFSCLFVDKYQFHPIRGLTSTATVKIDLRDK